MYDKIIFFIRYYLPALIWAGIIFYFSSIPGLRYSQSTSFEIILRKGAHFVEYGIFSFLLWRIFYSGHKLSLSQSFWRAFIFSSFFGISDEFHQTFITGRTGMVADAFFDMISSFFIMNLIIPLVRRKINYKNILVLFFSAAILSGLIFWMIEKNNQPNINSIEADKNKEYLEVWPKRNYPISSNGGKETLETEKSSVSIPAEKIIKVPFTSQAPYGIWDELHEEACEEASLIMIRHYLDGTELDPEIAEKEIQEMIAFEMKQTGDYKDTDAKETLDLFYNFYGQSVKETKLSVIYDFEKEDIKRHLSLGRPIIVPAAGRLLGNPYFTPPRPLYHNLVLVGYSGNSIIANDPGTKRGQNYEYDWDVLYKAIHDFPGTKEEINNGRKAMIVIE